MFQESMLASFDGTKLYTRKDLAIDPKGVVVIAHGLCEHAGRYDRLTRYFVDEGFHVYRYDQRGHGRSEGQRVFYNNFEEIAKDAKVMVDWAKGENVGLKVFLLGHSMGGYTATLYGTMYPREVNGIILSGALTRYNHLLMGELPLDLPANQYLENSLGAGVCSDPKVGEEYNNDPLVEKEISVGLVNTLNDGIHYLKRHATEFVLPVLILHGLEDGLVTEQDSREFFNEIASRDKTLHIYAYLQHEILNEPQQYDIFDEILLWLNNHI